MEERLIPMVRSVARSVWRFVSAVVLMIMSLCAMEAGFRGQRLRSRLLTVPIQRGELARPSPTTYLDVPPLLDLQQQLLTGESLHFVTNEYGCRGPSVSIPKPANHYRVLYLGGDDTFGVAVNEELTYIEQLKGGLAPHSAKQLEFINGGCPGGSLQVHLLRYRQKLSSLEPDLVVVHLTPADFLGAAKIQSSMRVDSQGMPSYAIHPAASHQPKTLIDTVREEFASADWALNQAGPLLGIIQESDSNSERLPPELVFAPVQHLAQLVAADEGQLLISISPTPQSLQVSPGEAESHNTEALERDLRNYLASVSLSQSVIVHNSTNNFQTQQNVKTLFTSVGHLTAYGHRAHAESLGRHLLDTLVGVWNHASGEPLTQPLPVQPGTASQADKGAQRTAPQ